MPFPDFELPPPDPQVRVLVIDTATGEILQATHCPSSMAALQAGDGQAVLVTDDGDGGTEWYAPAGVLTPRPTLAFDTLTIDADGDDAATLRLDGPFVALIDGVPYALEDALEIASDMPATYRVEIEHFPYRDFVAEIVAGIVAA